MPGIFAVSPGKVKVPGRANRGVEGIAVVVGATVVACKNAEASHQVTSRVSVRSEPTKEDMMTRFLGVAAVGALLGLGAISPGAARAQGTYPDVERQHEQHEKNVQQRQQRRAQHREQMKEHSQRQEQKIERHDEKLKRKNALSTQGSDAPQQQPNRQAPNQQLPPTGKP